MDLYCQRCGEPWEHYTVTQDMAPDEKERFLKGVDCPACQGKEVSRQPFRAMVAAALTDVLGDDVDGIAAEMEDAEMMFGGDFWN